MVVFTKKILASKNPLPHLSISIDSQPCVLDMEESLEAFSSCLACIQPLQFFIRFIESSSLPIMGATTIE